MLFTRGCPALYQIEDDWGGFTWLNVDNANAKLALLFAPWPHKHGRPCVCAFNFTPVPVEHFVIGLPRNGQTAGGVQQRRCVVRRWRSSCTRRPSRHLPEEFAGQPYRAAIDLPPLTAVYFDYDEEEPIE